MTQPFQSNCQNRLLGALDATDFALLQPHLQSVVFAVGQVVVQADKPIAQAYFVEQGIVSCIALASDGEKIEIGLVGREGMLGVPILLDADRTPNEARVQAAGWAWSIRADALREVLRRSPVLHGRLLRYVQVVHSQTACTALANGRYKLERRLARWLLMCHDRVEGDVLPTTHRFLSLMLGVNRPGLTSTVSTLERSGIIATERGNITIRDRDALLTMAGATYGVPEAEYERLLKAAAKLD